ncbi:MAG: aminoacyl-tRNA hydrolase [Lentimicrobiaceae bacterium]|nr:aminoacyl-tRNA hydrolase [Lentimicrobiaceae bacterium]MCB9023366.1 aminoacyl-tRNA hydrolase [Lentimicrobiaceae bacterium]
MEPLHLQYKLPDLEREIEFSTSKSSGKGGQHVNTTETRVELRFNIPASVLLTENQKYLLMDRLSVRLTQDGTLRMVSQKERSQSANKEDVLRRFFELILKSLKPKKVRIAKKPGRAAKESRLQEKKARSDKKETRKPPEWE